MFICIIELSYTVERTPSWCGPTVSLPVQLLQLTSNSGLLCVADRLMAFSALEIKWPYIPANHPLL